MKRLTAFVVAGATLVAVVPSSANAALSTVRAERAAERAIAPLQAESSACFRATFDPRKRKIASQHVCVMFTASAPGETCAVTVTVTEKRRPRRVSAKVTVPHRCFATPLPPGQG
jgi:hypothetical protein